MAFTSCGMVCVSEADTFKVSESPAEPTLPFATHRNACTHYLIRHYSNVYKVLESPSVP